MMDAVNTYVKNKQPITFSVSASLLRRSVIPLKWLCEQFDASLTIYHLNPEDYIDFSELVYARYKFPKTNVFYDLPPETLQSFLPIADNLHALSKGELHKLQTHRPSIFPTGKTHNIGITISL